MDRRTFLSGSGAAGLAGLSSVAGCAFLNAGSEGSGRHVPADWRPGPGEWANFLAYGPHGNRYNPHATPPRTEPEVDWETDYEHSKTAHPSFVIAGDTMYVRQEPAFYALDTETGDVLWNESRSEFGRITYVEGRLYHDEESVEALDMDGERIWRMEESGGFVGEMEGYVYTRTEEGIAWHDSRSGDRVDGAALDTVPATIVDGTIYGLDDGIAAYEHDGDEPSRQWHAAPEDAGSLDGNRFLGVVEDTVYISERTADRSTRLGRYSIDGERLETETWDTHRIDGLVVADGVEYLTLTENDPEQEGIQGTDLRASDGDALWEESFESGTYGAPVVANDTVYLTVGSDVVALDAETGETVWELEDIGGHLAVVGDTIYAWGLEFRALRA